MPARVPRVGRSVVSKEVQDRRITVIRELWFTDCTLTAIGGRLGMLRNAVAKLAKQVGLPPRHSYTGPMPKPGLVPSEPRRRPQKGAPTSEQIAQVITAKLKSPWAWRTRRR